MPRVKKARFNVRLHPTLISDIKEWAKKKELNVTQFVEIVLRTNIKMLKDQEQRSKDAEQI